MTTKFNVGCLQEYPGTIHYIPADIKFDGSAKVDEYFETTIRQADNEKTTASLRGRPLHGEVLQVPEGYTGLIVKETRRAFTEDEDRELTATHAFKQINFWALDRDPSAEDKLRQALDWIDIAKELHRPVDQESSQESSQGSVVDK